MTGLKLSNQDRYVAITASIADMSKDFARREGCFRFRINAGGDAKSACEQRGFVPPLSMVGVADDGSMFGNTHHGQRRHKGPPFDQLRNHLRE